MSIATFPPPSLSLQLTELRRERAQRDQVYPRLIANRRLSERDAGYRNNALDGAIATLQRLVDAQARGEPGRGEMVAALRALAVDVPGPGSLDAAVALLARLVEGG